MGAGLLLALGFTAPAGAAATGTAKTSSATTVQPDTLSSCLNGMRDYYEFYTWCKGTSPTSYRTIALCDNGDAVLGVEYADGSGNLSYANCRYTDNLYSQINVASPDYGILLCSNSNGAGTYQGYIDRGGDISWILLNWGGGNITTGGTTLCDYSTSLATSINPNVAPT